MTGNSFKLIIKDDQGYLEVINNGNTILMKIDEDIDTLLITDILLNYKNTNIFRKKNVGLYA